MYLVNFSLNFFFLPMQIYIQLFTFYVKSTTVASSTVLIRFSFFFWNEQYKLKCSFRFDEIVLLILPQAQVLPSVFFLSSPFF